MSSLPARPAEASPSLRSRLREARSRTDALFQRVDPAAVLERPVPERHRLLFYRGHLEAFDWNLLGRRVLGLRDEEPELDRLFAFGIDPVDGGLPADSPEDWPPLRTVEEYVERTRARVDRALERHGIGGRALEPDASGRALHIAIEHRLMHAETLAYMLHRLEPSQLRAPSSPAAFRSAVAGPASFRSGGTHTVVVPAGVTTLGRPHGAPGFGWDNELGEVRVEVPGFRIDRTMVTNARFLEFMEAGGYDEPGFWAPADRSWKDGAGLRAPSLWRRRADRWMLRILHAEIPLPLDAPVYVSHAEASAFARWAGRTLPTEAQWHRAAYGTPEGPERAWPWGEEPPGPSRGNFDFAAGHAVSVHAHPAGESAFGARQLLGNGWEWTSTVFAPFPGFEPDPLYPGYSADFFDGRHYVLKGGSAWTAAPLLRRSFRNWFQPHYAVPFAGFRCVEAG